PKICYNDKYVTNSYGNVSYYGRFICPQYHQGNDHNYCCGDEGLQYCCTFWDDTGRVVGVSFGIVGGIAAIGAAIGVIICIVKKKRNKSQQANTPDVSWNSSNEENTGSITFDTRTKAVMAEVSFAQENVKEKVNAVREVIGGKSTNEIVLVLQFYDYNVEKAIQAYCDDGAKTALNAWNFPGNKAQTKKKKNKKKTNQKASESPPTPNGDVLSNSKENIPNGIIENGSTSSKLTESDSETGGSHPCIATETITSHSLPKTSVSKEVLEESPRKQNKQPPVVTETKANLHTPTQPSVLSESKTSHSQPQSQRQHSHHRQRTHSGTHSQRARTNSERSNASGHGDHRHDRTPVHYRVHAGLEKSVKDLHRQTVSLERLRLVLNDEVEKTYKRINLNSREAQLLSEMDQVKLAAHDIYAMRQKTAGELKVKVDRSESMNDQALAELRSEIKHFVSDRKIDEDLGRTTRFLYDSDHLKEEIAQFAEVVPVKCVYSKRRPSTSSVASSGAGDDLDSLSSSLSIPKSPTTPDQPSGHHLLGVEETHEIAELQRRLQGQLQLQGIGKSPKSENRPSSSSKSGDAGRQSVEDKKGGHLDNREKAETADVRKDEQPSSVDSKSNRPSQEGGRSQYYYGRGRGRGRGGDRGRGGGDRGRGGGYRERGYGRPRSPRKDGRQGSGYRRDYTNTTPGDRNSSNQGRPPSSNEKSGPSPQN
ncbi:hypothetical protein FSP39_001321, partial [Pinctada imbricata]